MPKTTEKFDLHAADLGLARDLISRHIVEDDGEKCFNLFTYLEELPNKLGLRHDKLPQMGTFVTDADEVARYLWACIAIAEEGQAYPDRFRGMPILD